MQKLLFTLLLFGLCSGVAFAQESLWTYVPKGTNHVTVSPSGKYLVTHEDRLNREIPKYTWQRTLWDLPSGKKLRTWTDQHFQLLNADPSYVTISYDDKYLISLGNNRSKGVSSGSSEIRVWSLPQGKLHANHEFPDRLNMGSVTLLPEIDHVCVAHTGMGMFHVQLSAGQVKRISKDDYTNRILFSSSDRSIVVKSSGMPVFKSIRSYLEEQEPLRELELEKEPFGRFQTRFLPEDETISANGRWVATEHHPKRDGKYDVKLRVYDLQTKKRTVDAFLGLKDLTGLILSPDGAYVFATAFADTFSHSRVMIYDVRKQEARYVREKYLVRGVTPGGALITSSFEKPYLVLEPVTGEKLKTPLAAKWLRPQIKLPGSK